MFYSQPNRTDPWNLKESSSLNLSNKKGFVFQKRALKRVYQEYWNDIYIIFLSIRNPVKSHLPTSISRVDYFPKSLIKVFEIFFSALTDCYNFRHNADGPKQLRITSNTVLSLCILCCSHCHSQIKTPKQKKLHSPWRKAINTLSVSVMQPRLDKIKSC